MEIDAKLYFRRINLTNSDENIYYNVPILARIDPDTFVSTLLKLHPADQHTIMMAFKSRYENGQLDREFAAEKPWPKTVREKLMKAADSMSPIGKYRISNNIKWNIAPALEDEQ